jgi:hydrophobe/amphiphile efflux-1 (HAE1) family protein|uniref:Multidrug efflux RND transporter permease subunit n=1 Tax=Acidicaldus sp. TaxID=1872105 RepID=A0A8J4HBS3_9PROT
MSISTPFIRRPIGTSLLMAALLLVGIAAYPFLPVAPLPNIDFPTIAVTAQFPGASPETMAATVATPLEQQFANVPGVSQMTSISVLGYTQVILQFDLNRNIDGAAGDVQAAINAAGGQLPKNLPSPPTYNKVNPSDSPLMILAMQSDTLPITVVDDYAENIVSQQLSQISGVAQVLVAGQQKPAVRVRIDPAKLAAMGMTLEDVRTALTETTVDNPKGSIDGPKRSFTLFDNDQLTHAAEYQKVIVAYRNGGPVRVRDIGSAIDGAQNRELAAWQNSKRGILLVVFKQPGANVIDTAERLKAKLPQLQRAFPPSIHLYTIADRTQTIRASVDDVEFTLVLSLALVVMVVFLFLRTFWATIIPSIAIPLAIVCTFAVMYALGYSLDNLSLMALTIAVGFVVDDAIVMLENIFRYIEDGMRPMEAALRGAGEIGFTIVSISLSLVAVFIPLLLMGGIIGRLFREFAVTLSMAVLVSGVVSLTLTPMMCSRFLRHETRHGMFYNAMERVFDAMVGFYARTLDIALRYRFIMLLSFLATVAFTVYLYIVIPKGFFPQQDTGLIIGMADGAQDVSFDEMYRRQEAINDVVRRDPSVDSFVSFVGGGAGGQTVSTSRTYISLKPWGQRRLTAQQVIEGLRPKLAEVPGVRLYLQAAQDIRVGGRLSRTMYEYTLQDPDLGELYAWAPKVLARLRKIPLLRDVATDQQMAGTTATLVIDRDKAAMYGIEPQQIDDILYDAFGQREVTQYFTQLNYYYVILEVPPGIEGRPDTLDLLYAKSQSGAVVPLSTFIHYDTAKLAPLSVSHQSLFPSVTISFNLAPGAALGDAVTAINAAEAELGMPATVQGSFQGTAQAFQASLSSQPYLIAAALIAVYIILGVLYESYILPLTIISTLPSAGVGALVALLLTHNDLSVIAIIGIILLIGIVKKNGIMMVDFAIHAERNEGLAPLAAIRQACLLRFRPILMTTMAALLSGLPLMLEHGMGSELRRPLGVTMVGGLLLSQILTLYTTPVVYLYLDQLQHWLAPRRSTRVPRLAEKMGASAD